MAVGKLIIIYLQKMEDIKRIKGMILFIMELN